MRISSLHINSAMYIYPSKETALKGVAEGGSGFFVGMSAGEKNAWFIYAVTNKHVIAHCSEYPFIRANKHGGGFVFLEAQRSAWQFHPNGDDLAVYQVKGLTDESGLDIAVITPDEFVTPLNLEPGNLNLGPGDNTYMIGRFVNHEGTKTKTPIVRYGNISLNPDKDHTVYNTATQHEDEVFLIEARSVSGYSGSAVFAYIPPFDDRATGQRQAIVSPDSLATKPYFLGVNIGHTPIMKPVVVPRPPKPGNYQDAQLDNQPLLSEYNSGIMRIAPAWKLQEMLDMEIFAAEREKHLQGQHKKEQGQ